MAFQTVNGYDVEHASSLVVYENLFPEIQHINGKGVTDRFTPTDDITSVTYIDVMRVLPYAPRFRQLGSANNGSFHNQSNEGGFNNAPQSNKYTIPVDLIYDEGVPITSAQEYSNPVALKAIVMGQIVKTAGMSINIITYAKQLIGFFRQGDNFDKASAGTAGSIAAANITAGEIANAVYAYDPTVLATAANSCTNAFLAANASLTDGIPEIGALTVPSDERQAFISAKYDRLMKGQYMQNASDVSARILGSGFINPFTNQEGNRIDGRTGMAGMYDGVDMFIMNSVTRKFVYVALGVAGTSNDASDTLVAVRKLLDQIDCILVYGAGTVRGVVGPTVLANPNPYFGGVYILPQMKAGVECLHGATIKLIIDGGAELASTWTAANIASLMNALKFTAIDGKTVTGKGVVAGFNTGTTN